MYIRKHEPGLTAIYSILKCCDHLLCVEMYMKKVLSVLVLVSVFALFSNCVVFEFLSSVSSSVESASESLESVSKSLKSISSSINSSSDSSSGDDKESEKKEQAYIDDIREFTVLFTQSSGSSEDFLSDLDRVARSHGITNWQARPATYSAIGAGLKEAGVNPADFGQTIKGLNLITQKLIRSGYSS